MRARSKAVITLSRIICGTPASKRALPGQRSALYRLFTDYTYLCLFIALLCSLAALYVSLGSASEWILKSWFNSDWLFSAQVYRDIFVDHFPISGMVFPTAPCLFPDVLFAVMCVGLSPNALVGTLLYGFCQFVSLILAFHLLGSIIGVGNSHLRRLLIYSTGIFITLAVAQSPTRGFPYYYYLFLPTTHIGSFLMVTLCCALAFWILRHGVYGARGWAVLIIYCLLNLASCLSDLLFLVHLTIALTCAMGCGVYFRVAAWRRALLVASSSWVFSLAGWRLKDWVFTTTPLPTAGFDQSLTSLTVVISGMRAALLSGERLHLCSFTFYALSIATVAWLIRRHRIRLMAVRPLGKANRLLICFLVFQMFSGVTSLAAPVWIAIPGLSQLHDYGYSMKYMFPFFIGPIFCWAILASFWAAKAVPVRLSLKHRISWKTAVASGLFAWPLWVLVRLPAQSTPLHASVSPFTLVRVLDNNASRLDLHYGLGGFWETRPVNLLSRAGLHAYPIDGALEPFNVLSNMWWYRGNPKRRRMRPHYNFIFLNGAFFKLSRETVIERFGQPSEEMQVDGIHILVYGKGHQTRLNGIFDCSSRLNVMELADRGSVTIPGACFSGQVGRVDGSSRETDGSNRPGYLVFGPYYHLTGGRYELKSSVDISGTGQRAVGSWDVVFSPGDSVKNGLMFPGMKQIRVQVTVPTNERGLLQMRVVNNGTGSIQYHSLQICRVAN